MAIGTPSGPVKLPPGPVGSILTMTPYGPNWSASSSLPIYSAATLLLAPTGSYNQSGPVAPDSTGALRLTGDSWLIEEGTTNLITDPRPASGSSWVSSGGTATFVGLENEVITAPSANTGARTRTDLAGIIAPSQPYALSVEAQYVSGGPLWELRGWAFSGISDYLMPYATSSPFQITSDWTSLSMIYTPTDPLTKYLSLSVRKSADNDNTGEVTIRHAQIEQKDHVSSYCPQYSDLGTLLPGYSWNGTPHASTSTRQTTTLSAPLTSFASAYIRYHEGDGTVHNDYLTDEGAIGTHGQLIIANDTATFTSQRALYMSAAIFFNRHLSQAEQDTLNSLTTSQLQTV